MDWVKEFYFVEIYIQIQVVAYVVDVMAIVVQMLDVLVLIVTLLYLLYYIQQEK